MSNQVLLLFAVVSFFYVISPGPAIFLAIVNGMSGNLQAVIFSSLGNILGLFCLSTLSMIGLGPIILASASLFFVIKISGAAYLIYLGFKQFKLSKDLKRPVISAQATQARPHQSYFMEGFVLAVTNPKPILFFVAIFPQFLDVGVDLTMQFFTMTSIFMALSLLSLCSYGYAAKSAKKMFLSEKGMKWFHRITGGLFVGMGFSLLQLKPV